MKLKKLFAGIVAVAMMATMGATSVFATTPGPSVVRSVEKDVSIDIVITGTDYGSETVKLQVENNGKALRKKHSSYATLDDVPQISVPANEASGVTIDDSTAKMNAANREMEARKTLHIHLPSYKHVGTYVYQFKQVAGSTAGMTYNADNNGRETRWLLVNVHNKMGNNGEIEEYEPLEVSASVLNVDPDTASNATELADLKITEIKNKYESGAFSVLKKVKGSMSDREKDFNFRVTFKKVPGTEVRGMELGAALHGFDISNLTWTNDEATYPFTLKHNDVANFVNVPYGVTVSVVELDGEKPVLNNETIGDYTVTYNNNKYTTGTVIGEGNDAFDVEITNTSNVSVDTGVILDNAPYIALLTIVAAGAVVMIIKKRRNYED